MLTQWIHCLLISLLLLTCTNCRQPPPLAQSSSTLRISCEGDPQTLDPRQARGLTPVTAIHMLYEGLMRDEGKTQPVPALAETIHISPNQKTYTFTLRHSAWSNGQPVTAYDFESTWKSLLNPQFPSANAYQLYVIRGAQAAKEGKAPIEDIGIQALDEKTLIVHLKQPTPYFLQLLATYFYYPVHSSLRHPSLNSTESKDAPIITNGPFQLERWSHHNELTAIPNPHYWDRQNVHLDRIAFIVLDNSTALHSFHKGELEWVGSPLGTLPPDALTSLKSQGLLQITPAAAVYFFRFNTNQPPFNHVKIRQAFTLALNRSDLVEHVLQGNQLPALGLIPASFFNRNPLFQDDDKKQARQLFQEALEELGITRQDLPQLSLCYASTERSHKIAQVAQQQWKEILGVPIDLQSCESKVYFDRLKTHDYQVSLGNWFADIHDPISFLEIFKFKENGMNNTQWEHPHYIALLNQSAETSENRRELLLKEAEQFLMQEMPIAPLFYNTYNYIKAPLVKGVYFSDLGYLDPKHAYLDGHL